MSRKKVVFKSKDLRRPLELLLFQKRILLRATIDHIRREFGDAALQKATDWEKWKNSQNPPPAAPVPGPGEESGK